MSANVLNVAQSDFVDRLVASGRFQNASEALRAGLHLLESEEAEIGALRARLQAGLEEAQCGHLAEGSGEEACAPRLRCRAIAGGTAISQDCCRIIGAGLPEALRFAHAGQHFVIFIEDEDQVIIIDFLHARYDLPGRLAGLPDPAGD